MDNLAKLLQRQGKYEQAEEMNRRALGVDGPDTVSSVHSLADADTAVDDRSKSRTNKMRRDEYDTDDEDERILYFLPSRDIDIEVLFFYLKWDSQSWEDEKRSRGRRGRQCLLAIKTHAHNGYQANYSGSETAARRVRAGASGKPSGPPKRR